MTMIKVNSMIDSSTTSQSSVNITNMEDNSLMIMDADIDLVEEIQGDISMNEDFQESIGNNSQFVSSLEEPAKSQTNQSVSHFSTTASCAVASALQSSAGSENAFEIFRTSHHSMPCTSSSLHLPLPKPSHHGFNDVSTNFIQGSSSLSSEKTESVISATLLSPSLPLFYSAISTKFPFLSSA